MERAIRIAATALITAGIVILADVALTLAWKEPVSSIYGEIQQRQAEDELDDLADDFPSPADLRAAARSGDIEAALETLASRFSARVEAGHAIGRISIPAIDVEVIAFEGTDTASLQKGPGHYEETGMPGEGRTIAMAGHRTTYLAPFHDLDDLEAGDSIVVEMPYASFSYRVERTEVVDPSEVDVIRDVGYERLVLTACHPLYSASQRIVAFARLKDASLFGLGRWPDP